MSSTDEITTGELGRRMNELAATVREALASIGQKLDERPDWQDVRRVENGLRQEIQAEASARKVHGTAVDKSLDALEDANKWLVRTTAGAVLVALASAPVAILVAIATRPPL